MRAGGEVVCVNLATTRSSYISKPLSHVVVRRDDSRQTSSACVGRVTACVWSSARPSGPRRPVTTSRARRSAYAPYLRPLEIARVRTRGCETGERGRRPQFDAARIGRNGPRGSDAASISVEKETSPRVFRRRRSYALASTWLNLATKACLIQSETTSKPNTPSAWRRTCEAFYITCVRACFR